MLKPIHLKSLSKLGTTPAQSLPLQRQVILSNQLVMIAIPIVLVLVLSELLLRWQPIKAGMIGVLLPLFGSTLYLNAIGKNTYSRILLCLFLPLYLLVMDIVVKILQPEAVFLASYYGERVFLMASICFPLLLFDPNEEPYSFLGSVEINILVLASYDYLHGLLGIDIYLSGLQEHLSGYHVINYTFLLSSVSIILSVLFLRSLSKQYQIRLSEENKKLDQENTLVDQQNLQLSHQQQQIAAQCEKIEERNQLAYEQNLQIEQSIGAAQRIQKAQLPDKAQLDLILQEYFIFDRPKDVVSGDFYWVGQQAGVNILMVGDCTGHGIAGAFMTVVAISLLDKIVHHQQITDPADILEAFDQEIKIALKQLETGNVNGLEGTVLAWTDRTQITASSAKSSFHVVSQGVPKEYKGARRAVGGNARILRKFENTFLNLQKGDSVYLYSDGYSDQNDPARSRFGKASFQNLLRILAMLPQEAQEETASNMLDQHKSGSAQRDDIIILGFKI